MISLSTEASTAAWGTTLEEKYLKGEIHLQIVAGGTYTCVWYMVPDQWEATGEHILLNLYQKGDCPWQPETFLCKLPSEEWTKQ